MKNFEGFVAEELPEQEMNMLYSLLGKKQKIESVNNAFSLRHFKVEQVLRKG